MNVQNPIIRGTYPDPSICRRGRDYFLVNSSFDYFPGLPLFHSKNLVEWQQIGNCLTRDEQLDLKNVKSSLGIFAPTIRYINERFYIIFTNTNSGQNLLIQTADPFGDWSDPLPLEWGGIDPSLFADTDGKIYVQGTAERWGEEKGIYQAELDLVTGKLLSPRTLISKGTGHKSPEGPHLYRKDDWYYLMMAEGGTEFGHMETIFRSRCVNGPFESFEGNPFLTNRSTGSKLHCVGHADLVDSPTGDWFAVCLATRIKGSHNYYHFLGRETNIAPIEWTEEGWPIVRGQELLPDFPLFEGYTRAPESQTTYDFSTMTTFSDEWLHISNPLATNYQFCEDGLQLQGGCSLSEIGQPTFVGLRQDEFTYSFAAEIESMKDTTAEIGVSVYMSHAYHVDFFIQGEAIWVRKKIASLESLEQVGTINQSLTCLKVSCDGQRYQFVHVSDEEESVLAEIETIFLSTEISGTFTGVIIGLYASEHPAESSTYIKKVHVKKICE